MCLGRYPAIREELNSRGWVENTEVEEDVVPKASFHLLYATKSKAAFEMELSDNQLINHFEGAKALTTKVGLVHSIKSLTIAKAFDVDSFFPQSYDLTCAKTSEEVKEFKEDFNFCQVIAFLKSVLKNGQASLEKQHDRCLFALHFCNLKLEAFSPNILEKKKLDNFRPLTD